MLVATAAANRGPVLTRLAHDADAAESRLALDVAGSPAREAWVRRQPHPEAPDGDGAARLLKKG